MNIHTIQHLAEIDIRFIGEGMVLSLHQPVWVTVKEDYTLLVAEKEQGQCYAHFLSLCSTNNGLVSSLSLAMSGLLLVLGN